MRIVIVAVGRAKEPAWRALMDDYARRIRRYADLAEIEVRDDAAIAKAVAGVGDRAETIAMDVKGAAYTSEAFARWLGGMLDRARVPVFLLGGAEGLPASVRSSARASVSLGPMTLPHRLARVVLAEQLYRAFTILRNEPYAREG